MTGDITRKLAPPGDIAADSYGLLRTFTDSYGPDGDNLTFDRRLNHSGVQSVVAHEFSEKQAAGLSSVKDDVFFVEKLLSLVLI